MSPKTFLIAAAFASAAFALPAVAQEGQSPDQSEARPVPFRVQVLFNLVDVNSDGAIDQTETAALQRAIFGAVDADGDGKITEAEFGQIIASMGPRAGRHGRFMHGGPGRQGHFMGRGQRGDHGPRGDRPRDGRQGELMPHEGGAPMPQLGDMQMPPALEAPQNFASLDTNGDGSVSVEEFAAAAPELPALQQ